MRLPIAISCLIIAASPAHALNKCVDADGNVTFTDSACAGGKHGQYYTPPPDAYSSSSTLRPGEQRMLDRIREKEGKDLDRKYESRDFERRHRLTFGDRKRIRELEMKKGQLSRTLERGNKTWSQNMAIERQIHDIDQQIEQIRSPKY